MPTVRAPLVRAYRAHPPVGRDRAERAGRNSRRSVVWTVGNRVSGHPSRVMSAASTGPCRPGRLHPYYISIGGKRLSSKNKNGQVLSYPAAPNSQVSKPGRSLNPRAPKAVAAFASLFTNTGFADRRDDWRDSGPAPSRQIVGLGP